MATTHALGRDLTTEEWESFEFRFGLVPEHGVQTPYPMHHFTVLPREKLAYQSPCSRQIVGFEVLFHDLGRLPTVLAFKYFFNASTHLRTQTLSRRWGVPTLIHDKKSKKNWQGKFLWMNNDIVVLSYLRAQVYVNRAPTLFGADKELTDVLEKININGEDWLDCFLAAVGMRAVWRARRKMPDFFVWRRLFLYRKLFKVCSTVSLSVVTSIWRRLFHPLVFSQGIKVIFGSESVTGVSEDPHLQDIIVIGVSQKDPTLYGFPRSLRRGKRCFASLEAFFDGRTETANTEPPLRKKHNMSFLLEGTKDSNRAPDEGLPKLPEEAQTVG
ncbi:unnamed protein product [Lactuca saligna]|uniref:Uncharacterized protein n=1 Tax=Lactuca saligna TaxID=75948 RepID=A0AA35ZMH7_LACSI|nr:unnamed protein product [Lactuca saligna]